MQYTSDVASSGTFLVTLLRERALNPEQIVVARLESATFSGRRLKSKLFCLLANNSDPQESSPADLNALVEKWRFLIRHIASSKLHQTS